MPLRLSRLRAEIGRDTDNGQKGRMKTHKLLLEQQHCGTTVNKIRPYHSRNGWVEGVGEATTWGGPLLTTVASLWQLLARAHGHPMLHPLIIIIIHGVAFPGKQPLCCSKCWGGSKAAMATTIKRCYGRLSVP